MTQSEITSRRFQFDDWDAAQEHYLDAGMTDGLPIIPPTEQRVRAMLDHAGLAPGDVIGVESIRQKRMTAEKVAINAVMAGCKPEYLPVVVAAAAAVCEPLFNLHASSTSTNGIAILVLVSGPYANEIGMNARTGMMGNGNRANATIGRAINLLKTNFYGSTAQDMDQSTLGYPGKYSFCFAENVEVSPWPSLAVSKGFHADATTVTTFAANSPLQVSAHGGKDPEDFFSGSAHAMQGLGPSISEVLVVISPELMSYISEAGWSRERIAEFLCTKTQAPAKQWAAWHRIDQAVALQNPDATLGCVQEPGRITVVPGGGAAGAFTALIASWASSRSVTKEVQLRR
ncbi:MAG: hypothetical protein QGH97_14070 [Dehalococcoidia bacterium]|jgi:hypothetical protein|nr:hypothetical protein [Dehalococcoidia bacterium]MDP7085462.1 hypothetical protein [Dehalococcoidia bacterium]MDP7199732.1 hypothetical protein [Dehalococcoidia bacterium]MDP7511328.1 hypothetical protein [Dehalococcoidia bacterium]